MRRPPHRCAVCSASPTGTLEERESRAVEQRARRAEAEASALRRMPLGEDRQRRRCVPRHRQITATSPPIATSTSLNPPPHPPLHPLSRVHSRLPGCLHSRAFHSRACHGRASHALIGRDNCDPRHLLTSGTGASPLSPKSSLWSGARRRRPSYPRRRRQRRRSRRRWPWRTRAVATLRRQGASVGARATSRRSPPR